MSEVEVYKSRLERTVKIQLPIEGRPYGRKDVLDGLLGAVVHSRLTHRPYHRGQVLALAHNQQPTPTQIADVPVNIHGRKQNLA